MGEKAKLRHIQNDRSGSWMKIYLNTDATEGYQFVLNNTPEENGITTLAKISSGLVCHDVAKVNYTLEENKLTVELPLSALDHHKGAIWFKVADSTEEISSIEDFYDKGDVAPVGRLNYVYKVKV